MINNEKSNPDTILNILTTKACDGRNTKTTAKALQISIARHNLKHFHKCKFQ